MIASFNRMKALTEDLDIVRKAVGQSDMLRLSDDGARVKRTKPLPLTDTTDERSIYAKGFPVEEMSIDRLKSFFSKFGKVNAVRLRRFKDTRDLKPSAFIEFAEESVAQSVAEKTDVKFSTADDAEPLVIMMKKAYFEKKKKQREEARKQAKEKEAKRKLEELKENLSFTKGCLVRVTGMGTETAEATDDDNKGKSAGMKLVDTLKEKFGKFGSVGFVDFVDEADKTTCVLRFNSPEDASKAVDEFGKSDDDTVFGKKPTLALITGDDEENYYLRVEQQKASRRTGKKRHHSGKRDGGNKPAKQQKTE